MAPRKPRDFDAELQVLMERAKKLKGQKTTQLGELVQVTGADSLPVEAFAGVLLAAVEQAKKQPDALARWTERGSTFFRDGTGGKRGSKAGGNGTAAGTGDAAGGAAGNGGRAAAPGPGQG